MKKVTLFFTFAIAILLSPLATAQTELRILDDMGTRFSDVNDSGIGVLTNGYYNFITGELSELEPEATGTVAINNDGNIAGYMYYDEPNFIQQAAYRIDDIWKGIGFLPEQDPETDTYTTYAISQNSKYITGQTHIGLNYGGFLYDTDTETLTGIFDPEGEAAALYTVNSEGIAGGWVDRPDGGGTLRVPAYRTTDGEIHLIPEQLPEESGVNAISYITDNNIMVGDYEFAPFIYDLNEDTFTSFEVPGDALSAAFTQISDNGVAVGYAEVEFQIRDAIVYHPSIDEQPVFLTDLLNDRGIEINTPDGLLGTAIAISPNGEYIVGWVNGPPMFAEGWILYIDDLILGTENLTSETITAYPNPVRDILNISANNVDNVAIYTITGQKVMDVANTNQIDFSGMSNGVYLVKIFTERNVETVKVIKE